MTVPKTPLSNRAFKALEAALGDTAAAEEIANIAGTRKGSPEGAAFAIGPEIADVRQIGIQLLDGDGQPVAFNTHALVVLCGDANGDTPAAGVGSVGLGPAPGGEGDLLALGQQGAPSGRLFQLLTNAQGGAEREWEDAASEAVYLAIIHPNGRRTVSPLIQNVL